MRKILYAMQSKAAIPRSSCLVVLALIMLIASPANRALAADASPCAAGISARDCAALYGPWPNYVPDDGANACSGTPTLTGSDNLQKIFNYLAAAISPMAAAGIMGNMSAESGYNPSAEQTPGAWEDMSSLNINEGGKGGVGLVQWDGSRRPAVINYLTSRGLTDADLHTPSDKLLVAELDYIMVELNGPYKDSTLTPLKAATSPGDAAFIFHKYYEVSSDDINHIQNRVTIAEQVYAKYGARANGATGTSSCTSGNSQFTLDGSGFVYYSQCDPQWGTQAFAGTNICAAGCGPTSMAMIISTLEGLHVTPDQTAAYVTQMGDILPNGDISWKIETDLAAKYNLKATNIGLDVNAINNTLLSGGLVITSGLGPAPFTTAGHFIVIRGVTADGKWLLGDPDTEAGHSSTTPWDPAAVINAGMMAGSTDAITK